jgi:hypothetical protein
MSKCYIYHIKNVTLELVKQSILFFFFYQEGISGNNKIAFFKGTVQREKWYSPGTPPVACRHQYTVGGIVNKLTTELSEKLCSMSTILLAGLLI